MIPVLVSLLLLGHTFQSPAIHAESERYSVDALDTGGGDRPARVIVSNNITSRRHMVMVNSTLGELRRAVIRDDQQRVTLVSTKGFAVIDPAGVANTDEVYGLDAIVSPGGRWIAFRRFYPPTHPGPTEGVAAYDTRQSVEKNHAAYPIAAEREWRAGYAIFPPAEEWNGANAVAPAGEAYTLTSPLAWEGERDALVLLFSVRRAGVETVVLSELGGNHPRACWKALPGRADQWRVKTMTYARSSSGEHVVRVTSGAIDGKNETTISLAGTACRGAIGDR